MQEYGGPQSKALQLRQTERACSQLLGLIFGITAPKSAERVSTDWPQGIRSD